MTRRRTDEPSDAQPDPTVAELRTFEVRPDGKPARPRGVRRHQRHHSTAEDNTTVLDSEQHAELMALRAQHQAALRGRFEKPVTVMFSDLVGSTAYYDKYGDMRGREKVLTHNALIFPLVQSRGVIIKTIGDAIMACFDTAGDGMEVAANIQHEIMQFNADCRTEDDEIHVRIALNTGVAIAQGSDLHGDVVNVAARIEHEALPDEVWLSQSVHAEGEGWPLEPVGQVSVRGKPDPIRLYRLRWQEVSRREFLSAVWRPEPHSDVTSRGWIWPSRHRQSVSTVVMAAAWGLLGLVVGWQLSGSTEVLGRALSAARRLLGWDGGG